MEETTRDLLKTFSSPSFKENLGRDTMRVKAEFRNRQMFNVKLGHYPCKIARLLSDYQCTGCITTCEIKSAVNRRHGNNEKSLLQHVFHLIFFREVIECLEFHGVLVSKFSSKLRIREKIEQIRAKGKDIEWLTSRPYFEILN